MKRRSKFTTAWLLSAGILLIHTEADAAIINAASPLRADVAAALTLASNGDTIVIPAGTSTWTNLLVIQKAITIQGAGVGLTIIRDGVVSGPLMTWTLVAGKRSRITSIEFSNNGRSSQEPNGIIGVNGSNTNGATVRIDHCKFDHLNGTNLGFDTVIGVVDHNTFLYVPTCRAANVYGRSWDGGTYAAGAWSGASNFGTDRFMFFEDNVFAYDAGSFYAHLDSWGGGRWVARHNSVINGWFEAHGTDSAGRLRGTRAIEVYNNTFNANNLGSYVVNIRSGVAVIHDNTVNGFISIPRFELANYRDCMWFGPWGGADGVNPWDKNRTGGPFGASPYTASSSTGLTVTVNSAGWTPNQWAGYQLKRISGQAVTSITRSSSTATVTTTSPHGCSSGNVVTISGASPRDYNLTAGITVTGPSTFMYALNFGATPSTPATGAIVCMLGSDFSEVLSNSATVVTFLASGYGSQYDLRFAGSDRFNFWKVDQAVDQPGVSGGTFISGDNPIMPVGWNDQIVDPCYEWNNSGDKGNVNFLPGHSVVRQNVHFFNDTVKPGYTPYTYPHPLVSGTVPRPNAPLALRIVGAP